MEFFFDFVLFKNSFIKSHLLIYADWYINVFNCLITYHIINQIHNIHH